MSDSPFTAIGDEPVEARIVSWVLGEASAFEAAELERLCEERPELLVFRRRMRALHGLLTEAEAAQPDDGWKLPEEKRKALDEIFGEEKKSSDPVIEKRVLHSARRTLLAIAACLILTVIIAGLSAPMVIRQRKKSDITEAHSRKLQMELAAMEADEAMPAGSVSGRGLGVELPNSPLAKSRGEREARLLQDPEAPVNGPAGSSALPEEGRQLAQNLKRRFAQTPAAPAPAVAPPPVAARPKTFGMTLPQAAPASATASSAPVASPAAPTESAPARLPVMKLAAAQPAKAAEPAVDAFAMKTDSDADLFADEGVADSSLSERKPMTKAGAGTLSFASGVGGAMPSDAQDESMTNGLRSGDAAVTRNNIDAILNPDGLIADGKTAVAEKKKAQDAQTPLAEDMPVLGNLFSSEDKNGQDKSSVPGGSINPSGSNTYNGGSAIVAGKLELGGLAENAPASSTATLSGGSKVTAGNDVVFSDPDEKAKELAVSEFRTRNVGEDMTATEEMAERKKRLSGKDNALPSQSTVTEEVRYKIDIADKVPDPSEQLEGKLKSDLPAIRTNPALTQEHAQNVDKLRRDLYKAEGNYQLGKYDDAKREYENALRTDPYNAAARKGLEKIASAKSDYYRAAYDHTRAELLSQVDAARELDVPADKEAGNSDRMKQDDAANSDLAALFDTKRNTSWFVEDASKKLGMDSSDKGAVDLYASADRDIRTELLAQVDKAWEEAAPADEKAKGKGNKDGFEGIVNHGSPIESGKPASGISVIREFQYPTEAALPELPDVAASDVFPTTPATPDAFWYTSNAQRKGGIEYEIHTGYKSEYLFRGVDLGKAEPEPVPVPLVDLMEEIAATEDPYSTFSLNISDASFQVAQAALAKGERPDPAGIKVEQFYNAVDYGDPAPTANEPVAVNIEQAAHPVIPGRNLVRIALKTAAAGRSASQPLRLTLLVDQSGSMVREDRRVAMDKALASLSGLLTDKDSVTVIGFSRTPRLLADAMPGDQAAKLKDLVNQSASEGGTNLEEAIKLGEQMADRHKLAGAQNRIVLFTDGAANLGNADPVRLAEKVKQLRQKGVSFDIAGIAADGLNDELLGGLARNGNGRYYVVGKGADDNIGRQLAGAFRPAAENVKVQVRFNPERVGRYKLIGFEKDRLKTEDFRNDKVDAAELAADEAGVAVYQVEPLPGGNGELGEVSVRFRDTASGEMVERGWTIPHDDKTPAIDRATPSMQLATLAMLAAEKLKGGPLGEVIDFKQLAEPRANVKRYYGNNGRVGEVLHMLDALK